MSSKLFLVFNQFQTHFWSFTSSWGALSLLHARVIQEPARDVGRQNFGVPTPALFPPKFPFSLVTAVALDSVLKFPRPEKMCVFFTVPAAPCKLTEPTPRLEAAAWSTYSM